MGTRNLEVVILNGEVRVGQYCQWDGYPRGQGIKALKFLRDEMNSEVFTQNVDKCSWITQEELKQLWNECGADPNSDMVTMDVSETFAAKHPYLHRNCGANIFKLIQDSANGLKLDNSVEFAGDSLFCEWAYVVDLDKNTFEVYKGFNQKPLEKTERFAHLYKKGSDYYPVRMIKSYKLSELPTDEDFIRDLTSKEEE